MIYKYQPHTESTTLGVRLYSGLSHLTYDLAEHQGILD